LYRKSQGQNSCLFIVDRLTLGTSEDDRIIDSLETAMEHGGGACFVLIQRNENEWERFAFSRRFSCDSCGISFPALEPGLFSFNHSKGACPVCEGFGRVNDSPCADCGGTRLRREALAVKIISGNTVKNIAELSEMKITELSQFLETLELPDHEYRLARTPLEQIRLRLGFLKQAGLGYLTLSRPTASLSGGEQRRVGLTSALGSSLVEMLYVLDEPSIGLHPADTDKLLEAVRQLRDRGNTVILAEHEESFLQAADHIVEIGPGAGEAGGNIVFQGTVREMIGNPQSLTGTYLSDQRNKISVKRRQPENGVIEIIGCRGNNLKNLTAAFPLGMLCAVTGVSGAGKSSLVQKTLYPALRQYFGTEKKPDGLPFDRLIPHDFIEDVVMVDQSPIGRSPRSNPVTYLKIFDEIRNVFSVTPDAKVKNLTAGKFSFNVEGGRCEHCKGDGYAVVDMQFLPDMFVRCPQCYGKRYRPEVLEVLYRGKNIAEVLDMTAREAFSFFRGQSKVQQKLKRLLDVGLDYIRLGQPSNTLSGGESQRLKLAVYLSQIKRGRSLILLDEPTTGLHFADVAQLLDCFNALIETGHSLIVVEHNLQMIRAADYLIDLGPGAAEDGGEIVAQGTPEEVTAVKKSLTGKFIKVC
jgi:excinuclease ABC subunit A